MSKIVIVVSAVGAFVVIALLGWSMTDQNLQDKSAADAAVDSELGVSRAGQTAYISPDTGELTSTPPQGDRALEEANVVQGELDLPPVKMTTHEDGTVQASLNGRFRIPLTATKNCDGSLATEHSEKSLSSATDCEEK